MESNALVDLSNMSSFTLQDILQLGSLDGAVCLTDEVGVNERVQRINVVETAEMSEWVAPGELILTSGYAFHSSAGSLLEQIPLLKEKQVVGLCIKQNRGKNPVPGEVIVKASQVGLPLILLPVTAVFANIVQEGMEAILSRRIRDFQDIQTATEVLLSAMWKEQSPEKGLQVVEEVFHNPVMIIDEDNEMMVTPATRELLDEHAQDRLIRLLYFREEQEPFIIEEDTGRKIPILVFNSAGNRGMRMMILEYNDPLSDSDKLLLQQVGHSLILEMKNSLTIKKTLRKYKSQFVDKLLSGGLGDDAVKIAVEAQTDGYTLSADSKYRVIAINLIVKGVSPFSEKEVSIIRQIIRNLDTNILFNVQKGKLLIIQEEKGSLEQQRANYAILAEKFEYVMGKGRAVFCVSDPYPLGEIPRGYEQAMKISEIAQQTGAEEQVVTAEMLETSYLLSMLPEEEALQYAHRKLDALLDHDRKHNASLLETVRVYLEVNCNKQLAAEMLHIHYNTAIYRLTKAEELLTYPLADAEKRFCLRMALKLWELYGNRERETERMRA